MEIRFTKEQIMEVKKKKRRISSKQMCKENAQGWYAIYNKDGNIITDPCAAVAMCFISLNRAEKYIKKHAEHAEKRGWRIKRVGFHAVEASWI